MPPLERIMASIAAAEGAREHARKKAAKVDYTVGSSLNSIWAGMPFTSPHPSPN